MVLRGKSEPTATCQTTAADAADLRAEDVRLTMTESSSDYDKRFVGFIDILGFADLVQRGDRTPELRAQVIEALRKVRSTPNPGSGETDLRFQNFSDSLILSTRPSAVGLWHLLLSLDALAWNLLQIGVLVRGGVSLGGMHHDDEIVFGVGVIDAYRIESRVAKYPRIAISKAVLKAADGFVAEDEVWAAYRASRLIRASDGVWHVHYLNDIAAANTQPLTASIAAPNPWLAVGLNVQKVIQNLVDQAVDAPDVYEKVRWLADYWNREVVGYQTWPEDSNFPLIVLAGDEPRKSGLPFRSSF